MVDEYEKRVLKCIDRGLDSIGENVSQVFYWHLANKIHLRKEDVPKHPKEFIGALESMFGPGTSTLEEAIVAEIETEFRRSFDPRTFAEAMRELGLRRIIRE